MDVNLGISISRFLQSQGHDVKSVIQINPTMPDEDILSLAFEEGRIVVTIDKDFGELIFKHRKAHRGVIRLEDTTTNIKLHYLEKLLNEYSDQLIDHIIVIQNGIIRIRLK